MRITRWILRCVNDPAYSSEIIDDLKSTPVDIVGNESGRLVRQRIYRDQRHQGDLLRTPIQAIPIPSPAMQPDLWERLTSVELINPDGSDGFQIDAGINMHGGGSSHPEKTPKHSFTLSFKNKYDGNLNYPLFGPDAADSYESLILRAGFNNSWTHWEGAQRARGVYLQDEWGALTQLDMGDLGRHGTFVHLYINGLYWGMYNLAEIPNASFAASYLGGDESDYDVH